MMLSGLPTAICSSLSSMMSEVEVLMTNSVDMLVKGPASA